MGWREWVALPDLGVAAIKVKVDTGARSSSLHAFDLETFHRGGREMVRFGVHPIQRDASRVVETEAVVLDHRRVRSSDGRSSIRPVIVTTVGWRGLSWPIELTLARRDEMGFRMLLGRQAIRGRLVVDPGRSYYGGRPPGRRKKKTKKKESP